MNATSNKLLRTGLLLILAGVILIVHNLGLLPLGLPTYLFSWKMFLVLLGIYLLFKGKIGGGIVLIGIGSYFLLPAVFGISIREMHAFWPVFLIIAGISMLVRMVTKPEKKINNLEMEQLNLNTMENAVILGGETKKIGSQDFQGGKLTAILGGLDIDLSGSVLSNGNNIIDLFTLCGGISMKVPKEWTIKTEALPIMGGIHDTATEMPGSYQDPSQVLILRGTVVMGGVEIKRV